MRYRALFLSDIHLATPGCRSEDLLSFLKYHDADVIYLVGDVIDFWRIRRSPKWRPSHTQVLKELLAKARRGARLVYIPGNHDDELRVLAGTAIGEVEIRLREFHDTASGKRFLVVHGDEFDIVMKRARWLAVIGDVAYSLAMTGNTLLNAVRRFFGMPYWSLSAYLKYRIKRAVNHFSSFETQLVGEARRVGAQGVICGHIHHASMSEIDGIQYVNTGDWMESCTAVVEHFDGRFEIIRWSEALAAQRALIANARAPSQVL